ncbi:conjugative transposon protein TraN [Parabacteroides sp. PF5-9]|uniref:conjugative transposon protein TraN n=1 Tax=Parabacteroides sp. PF5-9 TaxID=1742404 RepID=UPI002476E1D3|nr:conjugative transposon protein TraN [Parabacteroides sp. PF5-9]MDH6358922.1 conjugative transposon TraN protein [Parabacteroides sp. PF5-9]
MDKGLVFILLAVFISANTYAQNYNSDYDINVNNKVSTHITCGEDIQYVDISTDLLVGDIPVSNILRLKPVIADSVVNTLVPGTQLAIITIVTERYKRQIVAKWTADATLATSDVNLPTSDMQSYLNPMITMPKNEIYAYGWRIWNCGKKFYDVSREAYKLRITLNSIFTVGDYFFIDLGVTNRTKIKYDIDQIRFKIEDKKQTKATNFQQIEVQPEYILVNQKSFLKNYRNIYVFKKFTFPDEKVFTVEIAENQISGRTVILRVDYADVLNADSTNKDIF